MFFSDVRGSYFNLISGMLLRASLVIALAVFGISKGVAKCSSDYSHNLFYIPDSVRSGIKSYGEIISADAITHRGLFTVHTVKDKLYFEIPYNLFDHNLLVVSRIEIGSATRKTNELGYNGDEVGASQIRFTRGPAQQVFLSLISNTIRSTDSSSNGTFTSVQASNLQPILGVFPIKTYSYDSAAVVIDVTDFLRSDNPLLYFDAIGKKILSLGAYQKDRSYVSDMEAFPNNVELKVVTTYINNDLPSTFKLNCSFVKLPDEQMNIRRYDERVGFFIQSMLDFDLPGSVRPVNIVTRWRIEPKEEDKEKYLRGELVTPKKPIVYYVDPATPKKWVPYLIQGVNDWQKAFEKAGFKNAIYAMEAPRNDSSFSLYDARHNAIIYKASPFQNASGPQINDPRTGEILETHVNWYHNVLSILHDWYMVQAGPIDTGATKLVFDDSLMGRLIRYVCSHEIGHTLGLQHNMGASNSVPTDSLRSKSYLDKNGICPSIMDYARFNYVAQPEDHLSREELLPRIGIYDEWAIEWGYRWHPSFKTIEDENKFLDEWVKSKLRDKRLWWGQGDGAVIDPRRQTEDLGDDHVKSSQYGIANLKRVMSHLIEWTVKPHGNYSDLSRMYNETLIQYNKYVQHVSNMIGTKYWTEKRPGQTGPVVQFVPKSLQKNALDFLAKELFTTPEWLFNKEIFELVGGAGSYVFSGPQRMVLNSILDFDCYNTMEFGQMIDPRNTYSYDGLLTDLEKEIWNELDDNKLISFPRRILQKIYVERLIKISIPTLLSKDEEKLRYDYYPILKKHIINIQRLIALKISKYPSGSETRDHLVELRDRLAQAVNFSRYPENGSLNSSSTGVRNFIQGNSNSQY